MSQPFGTPHKEAAENVPFEARIFVGKGRLLYHKALVAGVYVPNAGSVFRAVSGLVINDFTPGPGWDDELAREYQCGEAGNPFFELQSGRRPKIDSAYDLYIEPRSGGEPYTVRAVIRSLGQKIIEFNCDVITFKCFEHIGPVIVNDQAIARVNFQ